MNLCQLAVEGGRRSRGHPLQQCQPRPEEALRGRAPSQVRWRPPRWGHARQAEPPRPRPQPRPATGGAPAWPCPIPDPLEAAAPTPALTTGVVMATGANGYLRHKPAPDRKNPHPLRNPHPPRVQFCDHTRARAGFGYPRVSHTRQMCIKLQLKRRCNKPATWLINQKDKS